MKDRKKERQTERKTDRKEERKKDRKKERKSGLGIPTCFLSNNSLLLIRKPNMHFMSITPHCAVYLYTQHVIRYSSECTILNMFPRVL